MQINELEELREIKKHLRDFTEAVGKRVAWPPGPPIPGGGDHECEPTPPSKKTPIFNYAYPATGAKSVGEGETVIRFHEGSVVLPDGSIDSIATTSPLPASMVCKSAGIEVDAPVDLVFGDELTYGTFVVKLKRTVSPNRVMFRALEFDYLKITTNRPTRLFIEASTEQNAVGYFPATYFSGKPYVRDGTVATAGTPVVLDVRGFLGTNAHTGTIENKSDSATLYLWLSDDVETYSDRIPLIPGQALNMQKEDIAKIKVDASANDTPYSVFAH